MSRRRTIQRGKTRERRFLSGWGFTKFFAFFVLLCFAALLGGFLKFVSMVSAPVLPSPVPKADGIVVWTGRGGGRLEAATQLLQDGHGERLLISGVNAQNSREDIRDLLGLSEELDSCCVDLDYAAEDTIGNARETAAWSKALGYEHILLVTSAYHMPRAKVEIRSAVGPIRITPYPVKSTDHAAWWKDRKQFDRYAQEYGKLLRSLARETRNGSGAHVPVIEDNGKLVPTAETPPTSSTPRPENTP